jgi:4-hydroxy-3-methylbut-2-en-1-yl diphosphate synthase IspG/GcpE
VLDRIAAMASIKQIGFGNLKMDGDTPAVAESVVLTDTPDIGATIQQIGHLAFGSKVVGSAVPMDEDVQPLKKLVY